MNLYEIDLQMIAALEKAVDAETGEILDEEMWNQFEALQMAKDAKIENIGCWVKNLLSEAESLANEERAFRERKQKAQRKAESLKKTLQRYMDGEKFKTTRCEISFRNTSSVEVSIPEAELADKLPKEYQRITVEPNKTALKEALKNGKIIEGCEIVTKQSMTIK